MTEAVAMITTGARAIGESFGQLKTFSDAVGESGPAFQKLRTISKKVHDQLTALETTALRMDTALSGLASTTKATGTLMTELDGATRAIPELTLKTGALAAEMERTTQASLKMNEQLHGFPEHAATIRGASSDVSSALAAIVDAVKAAVAHSEDLRANTADSGRIVEGAQRLLAGAAGLQSALDPIRGLLDSLADSIRANQQSLAASASGIQASIATSADCLQADVRRSGAAASLLTERLTNVAQFIIDQTRQCQGASS
jgi:ABC-type transporter Mla subunit MlaD